MADSILTQLEAGMVLGDGGYLLALENRGYVQAGPFTPEVTIEHPMALRALHEEFLHAGAEVLQVLTFYASENKLAQIGYAGKLPEINRAAVRIDIGGGCGCEGSHLFHMAQALGKKPTEERQWSIDYESPQSATEAYVKMRQE